MNFREEVDWDWTKFPVCDVYKDHNFDTVPVTIGAYDKRLQQLNDFFQNTLPADIYAFEEVSGEKAVREALPNGGDGYEVCTFSDFKVQRLAIAGRKSSATQAPAPSSRRSAFPAILRTNGRVQDCQWI